MANRRFIASLACALLTVFALAVFAGCGEDTEGDGFRNFTVTSELNEAERTAGGHVVLPRRVPYGDRMVEFLFINLDAVGFQVVFNASALCYQTGVGYYVLVGNALVCQNCSESIDLDEFIELNLSRGEAACWPILLESGVMWDGNPLVGAFTVFEVAFLENLGFFQYMYYNYHLR